MAGRTHSNRMISADIVQHDVVEGMGVTEAMCGLHESMTIVLSSVVQLM
jgi:hypothetical protein